MTFNSAWWGLRLLKAMLWECHWCQCDLIVHLWFPNFVSNSSCYTQFGMLLMRRKRLLGWKLRHWKLRLKLFKVAFVLVVIFFSNFFFEKKYFTKIMIEIKKSLFSQNFHKIVKTLLWKDCGVLYRLVTHIFGLLHLLWFRCLVFRFSFSLKLSFYKVDYWVYLDLPIGSAQWEET